MWGRWNSSGNDFENPLLIIDACILSGCTMSQAKDNARLKSYKNKSLNTDEMRRRREEEGLQLRKQKKDEQVSNLWCKIKLK